MIPPQATPVQTAGQLSAHLKSLRKACGMTQAELGQRIGVKQVRVADIERNPAAISVEQLLEIIHALDARLLIARAATCPPGKPQPPVASGEPGPSW
ncbi:MAG: helix-turn-helix domain-containing protein [Ramlibacter sp.]|nr:helix-turn-helix domain-containing protein [Ramlibacter sp.]